MAKLHPKITPERQVPRAELDAPFQSEDAMAQRAALVLRQQREQSGGLTDDPSEPPVDPRPFKSLRSR